MDDRSPVANRIRVFGPSVLMTLASGAVMMIGGHLFATDGWSTAGPAMIPAGPLISVAFFLARRNRVERANRPKIQFRHVMPVVLGFPSAGGGISPATSLAISVLSLLSGVVMVIAGYDAASWNLAFAPLLVLASGFVITGAFVLIVRADATRSAASATVA